MLWAGEIMSMTDQNLSTVPANGSADEAAMRDWAELLVARARAEGVELTGDGGLLTCGCRKLGRDR